MKNARRLARTTCVAVVALSCLIALPASAQGRDGPRFRGGVSLSGGGAFVAGWELGMVGVDGRLGVQLNNLIGIYAQPYFQLGSGERDGYRGFTGFAGAAAMVDFTFRDRFFAGLGGGGAILNNPGAGELHFRVGGYPLMKRGPDGVRRKGLMVGLDVRVYFASGFNVVNVMGGVGYEAF